MVFLRTKLALAAVVGTVAFAAGPALAGACPTDLNGDDATGFNDLTTMLSSWGPCAGCPADLDGDQNVGFADLTTLLNAWGPCPIDVFEYPAYYEDLFVVEIAFQMMGPGGPLVLPEATYDRFARDLALMEAAHPEIAGGIHNWRWLPFHVLITYDTAVPRDELDATLAYYQGEVWDDLFDGAILFLDFPMGANPHAMIPILNAVPGVNSAELNAWFGNGPLTQRWEPTDVGGGAYLWTVVVGWENGGLCGEANVGCDCFSTYEFLITEDGTLTPLSLVSEPSPWGLVSDCTGYPPSP